MKCMYLEGENINPLMIEKQQLAQSCSQMLESAINSPVCGGILLNFGCSRQLWFMFLTDGAAKVHREKVGKATCHVRLGLGVQQNCDLHMFEIFFFSSVSQMWKTSWGHPGELSYITKCWLITDCLTTSAGLGSNVCAECGSYISLGKYSWAWVWDITPGCYGCFATRV